MFRFRAQRGTWHVSILAMALGGVACATTSSKLGARFAREYNCPENQVRVVETDGVVYRVSGCGEQTEYACGSFASSDDSARTCEERGIGRKAHPQTDTPRAPAPEASHVPPR